VSTIPKTKNGYIYINVGSNSSNNIDLNKPKKANLTKTPLRNIEKFVEAST
jgi:hypothetical protein